MAITFEEIILRYNKSLRGFAWVSVTFFAATSTSILLIALAKSLGDPQLGILPSLMKEFASDGLNLKPALMAGFIVSVLASVVVDTFFIPASSLSNSTKPVLFIALITILIAGLVVLDLLTYEINLPHSAIEGFTHWSRIIGFFCLTLFVSIFKSYSFRR